MEAHPVEDSEAASVDSVDLAEALSEAVEPAEAGNLKITAGL